MGREYFYNPVIRDSFYEHPMDAVFHQVSIQNFAFQDKKIFFFLCLALGCHTHALHL